jgi:hypothetical protein
MVEPAPGLAEARWTTVGSIGSPGRAIVDGRGLVTPWPGGWSLDWWIGADDRWHMAATESGVRQRLVAHSPVVETAMRVPSGDAVQRVYGVPSPDGGVAVVEIENASPIPFAVALVVRPANPTGPARVERIAWRDNVVTVDGRTALVFIKPPARVAASTLDEGDVAEIVTSGAAGTQFPEPLRCKAGRAQAAFIFPLPHTAVLRVVMPLVSPRPRWWRRGRPRPAFPTALPTALPTAEAVAKGWAVHARTGMRFDLPPGRLADAVEANRRFLLLFSDRSAELPRPGPAPPSAAELQAVLDAAGPTFTWPPGHNPQAAARFLAMVRDAVVFDRADGLDLCSTVADGWAGQAIEVHDVRTAFGSMSFALRWHGDRPALLWELDRRDANQAVVLRAPGLDPSWSTTEARGEALLAPPVASQRPASPR